MKMRNRPSTADATTPSENSTMRALALEFRAANDGHGVLDRAQLQRAGTERRKILLQRESADDTRMRLVEAVVRATAGDLTDARLQMDALRVMLEAGVTGDPDIDEPRQGMCNAAVKSITHVLSRHAEAQFSEGFGL